LSETSPYHRSLPDSKEAEQEMRRLREEEYYLVPVREYQQFREWSQNDIDLSELVGQLWNNRWFVTKITVIATILGLVLSFLMRPEYTSRASLMPEYRTAATTGGRAQDLLQKYGGLLGIDGSTYASNSNAIRVELYPQIVGSLPFLLELLNHKFYYSDYDTTSSLFAYFNSIYQPPMLDYLLAYTIELPLTVKSWISYGIEGRSRIQRSGEASEDVISISKERMQIFKMMQERVSASLDQETGVVRVQVTMPNPRLAAAVGEEVIKKLTVYLKEYRTHKLKVDLAYMQKEYHKAKMRFDVIQDSLAAFRDANRNIFTARAQTERQRLQSKYDLANNLYMGMARQLEQTKLRLQEQTPMFKTLEPVQVPLEKSSPNRMLIILISSLLGGMGAAGYVFVRPWMRECF